MENSPQQSASDGAPQEAQQRREETLSDIGVLTISSRPSWGERLLHGLFAAMEACWFTAVVIGLASIGFLGVHEPFIAVWAPFVVLIGAAVFMRSLVRGAVTTQQGEYSRPAGFGRIYILLAVVVLLAIWSSVYVGTAFLFNPVWLLALTNDLLLLSPPAYHVFGIVLVVVYLCWRGVRMGRYDIEPDNVSRGLFMGMGIILAVVLLQGAAHAISAYNIVLLLLIPLFLSLSLITHALANTVFMRKSSRGRFQGSVRAQERSLLLAVVGVGGVLLFVGLVFGTAVSPTFLGEVQRALTPLGILYDLLAQALAYAAVALFTPIEWLLEQIHWNFQPGKGPNRPPIQQPPPRPLNSTPPDSVIATMEVIKVILPILVIALVLVLIWLAVRLRRARLKRVESDEEEHESLWSWELFWSQVRTLLRSLLALLWRRSPRAVGPAQGDGSGLPDGDPAARDVREIYRAMLKFVGGYGVPRKKNETPYELQERVVGKFPQIEQPLNVVTDVYTRVRYGEYVPDSSELEQVRTGWQALQHRIVEQQQTTS